MTHSFRATGIVVALISCWMCTAVSTTGSATQSGPARSWSGSYETHVSLVPAKNTCGPVTVEDHVTVVQHEPGGDHLSLTHVGNTYQGIVDHAGRFRTKPLILDAGSSHCAITISGRFNSTGFRATVAVSLNQANAPRTCSYQVLWVGEKEKTTPSPPSTGANDDFPLKKLIPFTYVVDYEPFWSPDGRQIVLISNRHGGMHVHVMDASSEAHGSDMRQLTSGEAEDDSPAWSPDGQKIAFVSVRGGRSQIFVMNADGSNVRQVTSGASENIHPMWSGDSSRILFNTTHFARTDQSTDKGSADQRVIGDKTDDLMDLATIRLEGTDLRRVTNRSGRRDASHTYASFSPDGKLIVHRRLQGEVSQIFVMNADGSDDHNVSGPSKLDGWPAWSPDGKRIIFARRVQDAFQIFVMNRDGSAVRQLTDALGGAKDGGFTNPRWSPDGTRILCSRRLNGITLVVFKAPN